MCNPSCAHAAFTYPWKLENPAPSCSIGQNVLTSWDSTIRRAIRSIDCISHYKRSSPRPPSRSSSGNNWHRLPSNGRSLPSRRVPLTLHRLLHRRRGRRYRPSRTRAAVGRNALLGVEVGPGKQKVEGREKPAWFCYLFVTWLSIIAGTGEGHGTIS